MAARIEIKGVGPSDNCIHDHANNDTNDDNDEYSDNNTNNTDTTTTIRSMICIRMFRV